MLKNTGYVLAVLAVGTVAIAWSHGPAKQTSAPRVETISPEEETLRAGVLPESKFDDLTFVMTDDR